MHRLPKPLGESPHRKTRRNFPILRNEQMQNLYKKSQKIQNIYKIFFFFRYIAERLRKSNEAYLYFLQSLQGHSLGFYDLIQFSNLFNEQQFFILFGTIS